MPGLSKVIVLDPDALAGRQLRLGFEREGIATALAPVDALRLDLPGADAEVVVVGGNEGAGLELVRRARAWLEERRIDLPIVFTGRGVADPDAAAAGADEVVRPPAYLRDVVTIARLLGGVPAGQRDHLVGTLIEVSGVFALVRALSALGRSATLTLTRGLRRGEVRFYHGEVTSAQIGTIHGQAALHQLLLWTDARFDVHREDLVRRHQIPLTTDELFADAERFLHGVRESSGGLSPAMVLEQDLPRVQSLAKQIPTEVYGVLRMFDGYRVLADVLEDSPYRLFETLRVTQRAVDAGLLRATDGERPRPRWRTILPIEAWLVGGELRAAAAPGPAAANGPRSGAAARPAGGGSAAPSGGSRKRRHNKKKRRAEAPAAAASVPPAAREIDWGELVPRSVGAEVGPLAGVVPASHVSGEIVTPPGTPDPPGSGSGSGAPSAADPAGAASEPTVVLDAAGLAGDPADARAHAIRVVGDTLTVAHEPARIASDLPLDDTKPQRPRAARATGPGDAGAGPALAAGPEPTILTRIAGAPDRVVSEASDAITAPLSTAGLPVVDLAGDDPPASASEGGAPDAAAPPDRDDRDDRDETAPVRRPGEPAGAPAGPTGADGRAAETEAAEARGSSESTEPQPQIQPQTELPRAAEASADAAEAAPGDRAEAGASDPAATGAPAACSAAGAPAAPADSTPAVVADEPSDGVVRYHIATAETAPVKRRPPPGVPADDDRPGDTTGEITMRRALPPVDVHPTEPSILISDLAVVHAKVSAIASAEAAAPATADASSPAHVREVAEVRADAAVFSDAEEAFFRAGQDKVAAQPAPESFDDLDEGYRPVGFWDRLRGKAVPPARPDAPGKPDKPDKT